MIEKLLQLLIITSITLASAGADNWLEKVSYWHKEKAYSIDCFLSGEKNDGKISKDSNAKIYLFLKENARPDYSVSARIKLRKISKKFKLIIASRQSDTRKNTLNRKIDPESNPVAALQYKERVGRVFYLNFF